MAGTVDILLTLCRQGSRTVNTAPSTIVLGAPASSRLVGEA